MPELLQATLLAFSGLSSAIWIGTARRGYGEPDQPALFCALLAFSLAGGTGACAAVRLAIGLDTLEAERWLMQATLLLGLPLVGVVALTLGRKWTWSRPTWGRIVIGLCAFFELARQLGWSAPYALTLGLLSALLVLYAGLLQWPARLQASAGVAGSALMLALLPWTGLSIGPNPLGAYQQFWLALACPIIAWMLLNLPGNLREEHSAPA
ncbi:hypothetical protein [Stutzerimonas stutzeri]|uniref:Uncharacterized protein n=1 Tax=Stutzerimonas stutzeri TaxID=316 RepID=A0A0D9AF11_STUST|nr:hypothetical protein [Stutzerimonas stutzeri]KJH79294.1 hypothetical protein UF78_19140 [Stutzerimonas stutzeri]